MCVSVWLGKKWKLPCDAARAALQTRPNSSQFGTDMAHALAGTRAQEQSSIEYTYHRLGFGQDVTSRLFDTRSSLNGTNWTMGSSDTFISVSSSRTICGGSYSSPTPNRFNVVHNKRPGGTVIGKIPLEGTKLLLGRLAYGTRR